MKRTALALIIPALLTMGAANAAEIYNKDGNKLDLYGKVDARHLFSDNAGSDGDDTYVRLGFKGETQITSDLSGYGQWEYNVQADSAEGSNQSWTRLGYAGLKFAEYGSFDYGRNYGVVYDVEAWTDMLPVFGGDTYSDSDRFMTGRGNGMATYRNTDFFGLVEGWNFALQYQGSNEGSSANFGQEGNNNRSGSNVRNDNGDGWGLSSTYDFDIGVSAGAAFASSDRTNVQESGTTARGEKADVWTVGLKYDANDIYLAAMYAEARNMTPFGNSESYVANKTQNFEVTAQYQFDFGLRPSVAYVQSKGKDLLARGGFGGGDADLQKFVEIGATYYFNKNFNIFVDYQLNLMDSNSYTDNVGVVNGKDDQVALAVTYQF